MTGLTSKGIEFGHVTCLKGIKNVNFFRTSSTFNTIKHSVVKLIRRPHRINNVNDFHVLLYQDHISLNLGWLIKNVKNIYFFIFIYKTFLHKAFVGLKSALELFITLKSLSYQT